MHRRRARQDLAATVVKDDASLAAHSLAVDRVATRRMEMAHKAPGKAERDKEPGAAHLLDADNNNYLRASRTRSGKAWPAADSRRRI